LEAGTLTQHLTYGLTEAGFDVVCMEARQVNAALSAMRNKTDKHDARGIAQILRSGWYSRVHVESIESHHLRALISCRKVMQRKCIDLENEIRGLLKVFGVKEPSDCEEKRDPRERPRPPDQTSLTPMPD
jgi:transposase